MDPGEDPTAIRREDPPQTGSERNARPRRTLALVAVAVVAAVAVALAALPALAEALLVRESSPQRLACIAVFCGGGGKRFRHAAALLRRGYGKRLLFLGTDAELTFARATMGELGLEGSGRLVYVTPPADSTLESARRLRAFARREGLERVIVVSSRHHTARIDLSLRALGPPPPRPIYCPVPRRAERPALGDLALELAKYVHAVVTLPRAGK